MKNHIKKTCGIIALLISLISLGFLAVSIAFGFEETSSDYIGMSPSFAFWIYAMIFSLLSMVFYFIDALKSIVLAFNRIFAAFNIIFALLIFTGVPISIWLGGGVYTAIWFLYYMVIIITEVISIIKHIKIKKSPNLQ